MWLQIDIGVSLDTSQKEKPPASRAKGILSDIEDKMAGRQYPALKLFQKMKPPLGEVSDLNKASFRTMPEAPPASEKTIARLEVMEKRTYSSRRIWRSILLYWRLD